MCFMLRPRWRQSFSKKVSYLEDHPMTCKWLITKVIVSSLRIRVVGPLPNVFKCLMNGGDPNYLQVLGWSSKYKGKTVLATVVAYIIITFLGAELQPPHPATGTTRMISRILPLLKDGWGGDPNHFLVFSRWMFTQVYEVNDYLDH